LGILTRRCGLFQPPGRGCRGRRPEPDGTRLHL